MPVDGPTVMCAVGDPVQAVYAFRGADPDSMDRLADLFQAKRLRLTYCFRCPRRMTFLASQINHTIRPAPKAFVGTLSLRVTARPFDTVLELLEPKPPEASVVFLARGNAILLEFLQHLYFLSDAPVVHWISPGVARILDGVVHDLTLAHTPVRTYLQHLRTTHTASPVDRTLLHILELSVKIDGPQKVVSMAPFLMWMTDVLAASSNVNPRLRLATVHAIKGQDTDGRGTVRARTSGHNTNTSCSMSLLPLSPCP